MVANIYVRNRMDKILFYLRINVDARTVPPISKYKIELLNLQMS
jgi:hypothetical protein